MPTKPTNLKIWEVKQGSQRAPEKQPANDGDGVEEFEEETDECEFI